MTETNRPMIGGVTPYLTVRGASDAIEFYKRAFGAEELDRRPAEDGVRLMHCHLKVNGSDVMMADEFPGSAIGLGDGPRGVMLHLAVDDADAWFTRATGAGATVEMPLEDTFWGDRYGMVRDPFGHVWAIGAAIR